MIVKIEALGAKRTFTLKEEKYVNGRIAITVTEGDGSPWGVLTVNMPEVALGADHIIVKTYSENEEWVEAVLEALPEVFEATGVSVPMGFVACPVYKYRGLK